MIVESPAKAKTIAGTSGKDFVVESSIGHIRDLPKNAAEIPAKFKDEPWARLGVDVDNDFEPLYVVDSRKKKVVSDLKAKLKDADELLLATDEDREGEAIAWHLREVLAAEGAGAAHGVPRDHAAGDRARAHRDARHRRLPRRRAGDAAHPRPPLRLRGLARPVAQDHAGAVGGARAVGRDAARRRARARADAVRRRRLLGHRRDVRRRARSMRALAAVDGRRVAQGRDFGQRRERCATADAVQLGEDDARGLAAALDGAAFTVTSVEEKPYTRRPAPPFMTSTLQQEASRKLRLSSQQTMRVAQRLYENGYITYMRTDSTTLSESALAAARDQARSCTAPSGARPSHGSTRAR